MVKTDGYIAGRLKWKAEKNNLPSEFAFYFENLAGEKKAYYTALIKDKNIGIPTLVFTQPDSDKWTLIGTRKLVWGENQESESVSISAIKEIKAHGLDDLKKVKTAINGPLSKTEWNELTLIKGNNEKINVYAHKGADFFAMWNIIRMLWQLNLN